jgi:AhpC/TSA family
MRSTFRPRFSLAVFGLTLAAASPIALGKAPTVEEALAPPPVQKDVDYDQPAANQIPSCTIALEKFGSAPAWIVRGPGGQVLRAFADTNNDNNLDQWSFFKNGIETYRDMDLDFNQTAEQFRWLGPSGIRWGEDTNGDGKIDRWMQISAEEVAFEVFAAVRDKDLRRFQRVLITPKELDTLGLGPKMSEAAAESLKTAAQRFNDAVAKQKIVEPRSEWLHFGSTRPGTLAAGTDGATQDIVAYENVSAMLESQGKTAQLAIGTLVRVGNAWRVFDIPTGLIEPTETTASLAASFFAPTLDREPPLPPEADPAVNATSQKIAAELEKLEQAMQVAKSPEERGEIYVELTGRLRQLAKDASTGAEQTTWIRQLAEHLAFGAQSGDFPAGLEKLEQLYNELAGQAKEDAQKDLAGYVRWRLMLARYSLATHGSDANFETIQADWIEQLEKFVQDYPESQDTLEAMFQLALAEEFAGEDEAAATWFKKVAEIKDNNSWQRKAAGALRRLESIGKPFTLQGKTTSGQQLDLRAIQGKYVLIHYWSTMDEKCREGLTEIDRTFAKYSDNFIPVGINLDTKPGVATEVQKALSLRWPQLTEPQGFEGPLALDYGILTVPTSILVDDKGNVVDRNVSLSRLEASLRKKLR